MDPNMNILKVRVDMIDSMLGNARQDLVQSRLRGCEERLQVLEKEIPASKACNELISKLHPLINDKKLQLNQINDKIESLLARKDELQRMISDLEAVKQYSGVLDGVFCQNIDIEDCNKKLASLTAAVQPLVEESQSQSRELDVLLEGYEKAMVFISDVCQSWDEQVKQLERER